MQPNPLSDRVIYLPLPIDTVRRYQAEVHRWIGRGLQAWAERTGARVAPLAPPSGRGSLALQRLEQVGSACLLLEETREPFLFVVPDVTAPGLASMADVAASHGQDLGFAGWWWGPRYGPGGEREPFVLDAHREAALGSADAVAAGTRHGQLLLEGLAVEGTQAIALPWDPATVRPYRQDLATREPVVVATHTPGDAAGRALRTFRGVARSIGRRRPEVRWTYLCDSLVESLEILTASAGELEPVELVIRAELSGYLGCLGAASIWWQASSIDCHWDYGLLEAAALQLAVVAPDRGPWKELAGDAIALYQPDENAGGLEPLEALLAKSPGERPLLPEDLGYDPGAAGALLDALVPDAIVAGDGAPDGEAAPDV